MAFKGDESIQRLLENTSADEPIFIIAGRDDVGAYRAVNTWIVAALEHNATHSAAVGAGDRRRPLVPIAKIQEALQCLRAIRDWPEKKVPD